MKNTNIGIANLIISNKLKESYFNENLIEESKNLTTNFFNVVKNSPILQLEFKVFNNLENKHIESDLAATRYIDNNIKLFEVYTIQEIDAERNKLKDLIGVEGFTSNTNKVKLYNAIDNLISESLNNYDEIDTDTIHESFEIVLNHIKSPKQQLIESKEGESINEDIIEIAINKLNEKIDQLHEEDKLLLNKLMKFNDTQKSELLEEYKSESLVMLESHNNNDNLANKIPKTIQRINEMSFDPTTVDDNIISLHELKKGLI